jgi:hypothetical protein
MADPVAYPLAWPAGWPRTTVRQPGKYRTSLAAALNNLRDEVRLLFGEGASKTLLLSSNATLLDPRPKDPGVVVYLTWEKQQVAIPCDRWTTVDANVQAIALTIEAMRAMERHGAKHMIRAMFQGFVALPAPGEDWRAVLGNPDTLAAAEARYRDLARDAHPDRPGGSNAAMARLNGAIAEARKVLS